MNTLQKAEEALAALHTTVEMLRCGPLRAGPIEPEKEWPQDGDEYWAMFDDSVQNFIWGDDWNDDIASLDMGNVFCARHEADLAQNKQHATVRVLKRIAKLNKEAGRKPGFHVGSDNRILQYCHRLKEWDWVCWDATQGVPPEYYGPKSMSTLLDDAEHIADMTLICGVEL